MTNQEIEAGGGAPPAPSNGGAARSCGQCDFFGPAADRVCPQCGEPTLLSPETNGLLGLLMAALGLLLAAMAGGLIYVLGENGVFSRPVPYARRGDLIGPSFLFWTLGYLLILGAVFTIVGALQFRTGRRDLTLIRFALTMTTGFFVVMKIVIEFCS